MSSIEVRYRVRRLWLARMWVFLMGIASLFAGRERSLRWVRSGAQRIIVVEAV